MINILTRFLNQNNLIPETQPTLEELTRILTEFQISEGYFSDILNSQLYIFSIIVVILIFLTGFIGYFGARGEAKKEGGK